MPFLPEIPTWEKSIINTQQFLGLNRGLSIGDGEMADMLNMSSDNFPVLSTRQARGIPQFDYNATVEPVFDGEIDGMLGTDRLVVCHNGKVYLDGIEVPITLSTEVSKREKKLVSMGAYVCIWPDKKFFNVNNPDECGDMGLKWEPAENDTVSAMMCRLDGTDYDMTQIVVSDIAPTAPNDRDLWLDTGGEKDVLKQYSQLHNQWVQVATTYIKIEAPSIGKDIKEGDVVWLSGVQELNASTDDELVETTGTITAYGKDVSITDGFTVEWNEDKNYEEFIYNTDDPPSVTQTIIIDKLPAKAKVKSAVLKFRLKQGGRYASVLTVNGRKPTLGITSEQSIPIEIPADNKLSVKIVYRYSILGWVNGYISQDTEEIVDIKVVVNYVQTHYVGSDEEELSRLNTTNRIYGAGDDYIIVAGLLHKAIKLGNTMKLEMKIPDLDYVCESNNRIWGCRYSAEDGTILNEIRCCALGDYRNWDKFIGTAADSYTMTLGSDGVFTGAYAHQGVPIFFKESFIHRISGTVPANYTLNTIRGRGVQNGSWKSLTTVNETLFYKARNDIMAYEGAMPYSVGAKLGQDNYKNAVGGGYRDKYYLCMQNDNLRWHTYVLDTSKGLWHQEGMEKISHMASIGGELVLAVEGGDKTELRTVGSRRDAMEAAFDWSVTFGVMGFQSEQQKYLSRYNIRAQMSAGSYMKVEMQYDSDGKWHHMGTMRSTKLRTFLLPIIPRRCDHCQLRLSGTGMINIYSVAREYENGGDG